MSLKAPKSTPKNTVDQPNLEPGSYPARVARVYGAGTHPQSYKGDPKPNAFILYVIYELVDAFMVDKDGNEQEDKPRWVMESFPLHSLNSENARSTQRYLAIDPTNKFGGDWSQLIGAPVSVTIVNNTKDGKTYDNVGNTTAIRARDAAKLPELANEGFFFDPSESGVEYFNKLPKFVQERIRASIDFPGSSLEKELKGEKVQDKPKAEDIPDSDDSSDDIPW